jgi:hypothetical protein
MKIIPSFIVTSSPTLPGSPNKASLACNLEIGVRIELSPRTYSVRELGLLLIWDHA